MSGKALIVIIASAGLLASCSSIPRTPTKTPEIPPPNVVVADLSPRTSAPAKKPTPRPTAPIAPRKVVPTTSLAGLIDGTVSQNGRQLTVTRGAPLPAVPLFRQAIVLADVRASLNSSSSAPQASFQRGQLHLRFEQGNNTEIASAINRVLDLPEVSHLVATLP
jgi:hypothetical protein